MKTTSLDKKLKEMLENATERELNEVGRTLKSKHSFIIETIVTGHSPDHLGATSIFNTASHMHVCTKCNDFKFDGTNLPIYGCKKEEV